jgi:hypothetical protein
VKNLVTTAFLSNILALRMLSRVVVAALFLNVTSAQAAPDVSNKTVVEQGGSWSNLQPAQRAALKPLEREWPRLSAEQQQKWLVLSLRFNKMSLPEQMRVQDRMAEWAKLTPQERIQARLNFQEAKQLPAQSRQARWDAYQALSPEKKQQLAARAYPVSAANAATTAIPMAANAKSVQKNDVNGSRTAYKLMQDTPRVKSNIIPNSTVTLVPRAVTPSVVQARPGATTTLITKRPMPPVHQQVGLPKIAATPEFVNQTTLLPQRGPQGAVATTPSRAATTANTHDPVAR